MPSPKQPTLPFNPRFEEYFERLIGIEAGYTKERDDPGNWTGGRVGVGKLLGTKYGIAANTYPDVDIAGLTLDQARAIYRRDWWDKLHADYLPAAISYQLWDMAVNAGMPRAVMALQRALGVSDDGALGEITMQALARLEANDALLRFNAERIDYYVGRSTWPDFGKGWMRRVAKCLRYAAQDN